MFKVDIPFLFKKLYIFFMFLKVPENGNYTFYIACDDVCELWLDTSHVDQPSANEDDETGKVLLARLNQGYWTDHNQWDK